MKTSVKIGLVATVAVVALLAFSNETPQEKEARHLRRGNEYFTKGEMNKARVEYKNAAKLMPLDPEVTYRWALVEEAEGNIRSAYANFIRAEQQDPAYIPALLKIAHYNLVVDQYPDVTRRIESVLAKDPENAEATALQAALALREQKPDTAETLARKALAKDPANVTAYSVLIGRAVAAGDATGADKLIEEAIAKNPSDIALLMLKVKVYENPLNLDKINEAYQAIIKLQPNNPTTRIILTEVYTNAGRLDDAENTLRTATTDIPDNWNLKQRLINFLDQHRGKEVSEKALEDLIAAHPDHAELYAWQAKLYLSHNNLEKATEVLRQTVQAHEGDKHSLNAHASLARLTFKRGDRTQAEQMVQEILKKSPNQPDALLISASMQADDGRYQNAVSTLRQLIRNYPRFSGSRQLLAEVLLLQGYPDLAIETLNQLLDMEPTNTPARIRLAQMYAENKDPQRALAMLQGVVKAEPNQPIGWENLARAAIAAGDAKTANSAIETLRAFKGQEAAADFLLGQLSGRSGKKVEARQTYTDIIQRNPDSRLAEHALFELVEHYHSPAELEQTVTFLKGLKHNSAYFHNITGECLIQLGKPDEAATAFDSAIAAQPTVQDPFLSRARLAVEKNDFTTAIPLLEKAMTINVSDPRARLTLAGLYSRKGDYDKAISIYEEQLTRNPEMDVAANNVAAIISEHKYKDKAALEKALKLAERFATSKNPVFLDTLGWVYYRLGNHAQAVSAINRAISGSESPSPTLYYHLGMAQLGEGNKAGARASLEKALAGQNAFPNQDEARKTYDSIK